MRAWCWGAILAAGLALAAAPSLAADPAVEALDKLVAGKPALERSLPIRVDVVGYDVDKIPRVKSQLQAVARAGGGAFSTAGVQDIGRVMTSVVTGGPQPRRPKPGTRLEFGETIIRHGRLEP
jgi:hypothetical protein